MKVTATDDTSKAIKVTLDGNSASISAGGSGSAGSMTLLDDAGNRQIHMVCNAAAGVVLVGEEPGVKRPGVAAEGIFISGHEGGVVALGNGHSAHPTVVINGVASAVTLRNDQGISTVLLDGRIGYGAFGGGGQLGQIGIFPASATNVRDSSQSSIFFNGDAAVLSMRTITADGKAATLRIGGASKNGSIVLVNQGGADSIRLDAATGDITLLNADCAEDFDLADDEDREIEPGTVMVLDDDGRIRTSRESYDSRVAGVLSGAGGFRPGLVLDRKTAKNVRLPLALMGKVFCKADARYGAIRAGDLLTTSPTPGHAMKVTDRTRALGSVLGKALRPASRGQTIIPILVTLQ